MIGTPVQNDDKTAGQRTLIGQNKKEKKMRAAQSLIFHLH